MFNMPVSETPSTAEREKMVARPECHHLLRPRKQTEQEAHGQFNSINTYDFIITLIKRGINTLSTFLEIEWYYFDNMRDNYVNMQYNSISMRDNYVNMQYYYVNMQGNYGDMQYYYVNMQGNYGDMQHYYVNMRDNYVNMRLKLCCMLTFYLACWGGGGGGGRAP